MAKTKLKPLSEENLQKVVSYEIDQAVDFLNSEISHKRILADLYYQGRTQLPHEKGRSGIIVSKVRDTIKGVLPSIGRVFTQTDKIVEFSSDDEEDEMMCKQATLFCNNVFHKWGGYTALIEATTDALKGRVGVVKIQFDRVEVASHKISGEMTAEEIKAVEEDEDEHAPEITEVGEAVIGPDGIPKSRVVLTRKVTRNRWQLQAVPPEEFIVSSSATCVENARLIGRLRNIKIYEAMEMGFNFEDLIELSHSDEIPLKTEKDYRTGFVSKPDESDDSIDPTSREVLIGEMWMRIDADGDGYAELRHITTGGLNYDILDDKAVQYPPLAIFKSDLQPHVFFPISLAEDTMQDQDAMTAILRSIVDNTALVNSPRTAANENMVNIEDLKNNEIGAIIRTRAAGHIEELVTPFVAGQTLPVLQYISDNSEQRSGVTKLSQGLDPDALQSTSRMAANAAIMGGEARIEFMARNIAETGLKEMFICILRTAMYSMKGKQQVATQDGYENVQPDTWHDQVNVIPNVGLGSGRIDEKKQTLAQLSQKQEQIILTLGLNNPVSGWTQLRNTYREILRLSGIKSISPIFPRVTPEQLAQLDKLQQESKKQAEGGEDAQAFLQAEKYKADSKAQTEIQKIQAKAQADIQELKMEIAKLKIQFATDMTKETMRDDRERDEQAMDHAVDVAKVESDEKVKIDQAAIKAETERQRPKPNGARK